MQMEVSFGSRSFSADVLDGILDCFWTSHEPDRHLRMLFGFNPHGVDSEGLEISANFDTFLALSLTCSTFRQLCLPRLFGTIYISRFKTLGLLWRSIQSNPSLGSYVHSFTIRARALIWPMAVEPSDGLGVIFKGQTMEDIATEVEKYRPGAWSDDEVQKKFKDYCSKGPDNEGIDPNLQNATDLKEALVTIFSSFRNLSMLIWKADEIPFLTLMVQHLENLDCLRTITMDISCCEEDFYYPEPPPEGTLHPPTPVWKLSKNVRELEVHKNGPGSREYEFRGIHDEERDEVEAGPRLERRTKTVIRTINEAENLEKLNLSRLYPGENDQRPEIFLAIFPQVCCIPTIVVFTGRYCPERWKRWKNMTLLYPALLSLFERKGVLKAEDIRGLGKDVEETIDHPLSAFASFLQEEELLEKIVERWNKRYSRG